ncbi:hypothetical protein CY34DRAFT_803493 [Suillus luteus UH-Slu-Lm8-n1]|uniref:Uncharacterized protein n=1 Tax=Suillus luteus UH-Slu-Lm8-n1 TaxID=930992 RepID=A0A0D0BBT7_9AGAM|nr:hypothetical protein CY34DRAFT_803493 [Suillus luteus UH-Slu-Lm8-n1]
MDLLDNSRLGVFPDPLNPAAASGYGLLFVSQIDQLGQFSDLDVGMPFINEYHIHYWRPQPERPF